MEANGSHESQAALAKELTSGLDRVEKAELDPSPEDVTLLAQAETVEKRRKTDGSDGAFVDAVSAKRLKSAPPMPVHEWSETPTAKTIESAGSSSAFRQSELRSKDVPVSEVHRAHSSGSFSSDLSSGSLTREPGNAPLSPDPTRYVSQVPPAPPSTPASHVSTFSFDGSATPLPSEASLLNATQLEQQQVMMEGAATPAPTKTAEEMAGAASKARLPEDFSEWAVGDRYQLVRMLGRGSYGEVAQAIDLFKGRPDAYVAIKRILSPFEQEVDAVRLYREIHILRRMRGHSCIINLIDVVQPPTEDLDDFHDLYLVFEYVDTDLYKLIMSPQYLTTEHIQTFLYQMLAGLKFIHSFSVIHRDLKPANILLNEDCSLKICDFGLARIVHSESMSSSSKSDSSKPVKKPASFGSPPRMSLTRQLTKHVVTRWYRAPELILIQPYTSAVDMWSLGCILAELLSMQDGNVPTYQDRKPLFPGGSCYPLSGEGDKIRNDDRLDQLSVIFGVIGTPSAEDLKSIGKATQYIESLGKTDGKPFEKLFPAADSAAVDLLKKMLQFNPKRRITAAEAVEHEFFKGVRRKELEVDAEGPLEGPAFLEADQIDLQRVKQQTYEEVRWFRHQAAPKHGK